MHKYNIMNSIQQESKLKTEKKQQIGLAKYLRIDKSIYLEYEITKQMLAFLNSKQQQSYDTFCLLYNSISRQMKQSSLFQLINYMIWNNQKIPLELREKTQFFKIISDWIVEYEMKIGDLKSLTASFEFVNQFNCKKTKNMFERVVLIDQIHEDLLQMLGHEFWDYNPFLHDSQKQIITKANKQSCQAILNLLQNLVTQYSLLQGGSNTQYFNCQLYLLRDRSAHYKQFIIKCIQYSLSANAGGKKAQQNLQKHQQMLLTKLTLIFLQRPDLEWKDSVKIIKLLMLRTSKMVRYAMVVDYVKLYDYLQKAGQDQIIQELENMVYFRELIIGRVQINDAGLISNILGKPLTNIHVSARSKERIVITHEKQLFGIFSILELQILIDAGDISLILYYIKNGKQTQYWKEERTQDRRVDIILKEQGLYILQFNNIYSWIKPKNIKCKLEQYCYGI